MAKPADSLTSALQAALERGRPLEVLRLLLRQSAMADRRSLAVTTRAGRRPSGLDKARPRAPTAPAAPPPEPPLWREGLSPGEVPRGESGLWGWVLAVLLAYLAWRLLRG